MGSDGDGCKHLQWQVFLDWENLALVSELKADVGAHLLLQPVAPPSRFALPVKNTHFYRSCLRAVGEPVLRTPSDPAAARVILADGKIGGRSAGAPRWGESQQWGVMSEPRKWAV